MSVLISVEFNDGKDGYALTELDSSDIWDAIAAIDEVSDQLGLQSLNSFAWNPDEGMDEDISHNDLIEGNFELEERWYEPDQALQIIQIYKDALKTGKIVNNVLPGTLKTLTSIEDALIEAKDLNEKFIFLVMA